MTLPATMFKVFAPTLVCSRDEASGNLRIEGIASSTVRDHHGDAISQKALQKMADSALHMTIFMNHEYRVPQDVFGTVEKSKVIKTGEIDPRTKTEIWDLRFGIVVAKSNPSAVETFELIEKDQIKLGLSIGAMLPDGGYTKDDSDGGRFLIDDIDIIETSMVGIPASPRSFVDYAFKAITGVFPDSPKRVSKIAEFTANYLAGMETVPEDDDETVTKETEPNIGNTVEGGVTIEGGGIEEAEADADKEPAGESADSDDGSVDDGSSNEAKEASLKLEATLEVPPSPEHLAEGEEFESIEADLETGRIIVDGAPHPDITAQKGGHVHPHAHAHEHEHEHGFEESKTVHSHAHGHQHSHDHGADHDHDDTANDYSHSHPHNGSYDAEHAHEESSKAKKSLEPDTSKAKVTVWENSDGSKVTEVNTGRQRANADENQSVQNSSEPETTGGSAGAEADKTATTDDAELVSALSEIVAKSGANSALLIQKLVGQNRSLKAQVDTLVEEREALIGATKATLDQTAEIIRAVGRLPQGRKTLDNHPHIEAGLDDVAHIYDAEVRKLITRGR